MFNKKILITGGSGTVGSFLVKKLVEEKAKEIRILSRNEYLQYLLKLKHPSIKCILGDISDYNKISEAVKGIDYVIHTAAIKHVNIAEENPEETIKTNITGSLNVLKSAVNNNINKVIFLSTDKSNSPNCLYGSTKYISDKLCLHYTNPKTKCSIVRFGNIFGSKGSIIEKFSELSKNEKVFPITNLSSTRCFITLDEIYETITFAINNMFGGEIFIPKMKSFYIKDIPKIVKDNCEIKMIPFKNFEKMHEEIITKNDLSKLYETDKYYIISEKNENNYKKSKLEDNITSSKCAFFSEEEFRKMYDEYLKMEK